MKRVSLFMALIFPCVLGADTYTKNNPPKTRIEPIARWTGDISMEETTIISAPGWTGKSERHIHASFSNALPTMYREDETSDLNFTDDKGIGTHTYHSESTLSGIKGCVDCQGSGKAELHSVAIREWDNTYDIEVISPECRGANCDGTAYGPESQSVTVSNHTLGSNKDVLNGTNTVTAELPGDYGTVTKTITWHFVRTKEDDVELIVTPDDYDNWLPKPGRDEMSNGSVMTINLKLQGKNGKPLKAKVESFELHLNNTSIEPGITINYPIEPSSKQLPDLRFLLYPGIESIEEDQSIFVGSPDGITGKALIASYDGGGWSTLTAEAILKDGGRRVQGRLRKPGGEVDIRIPKREPNSKIGEAWLKVNGNPDELDDEETSETSKENKNNGDGLTAYEEYRGVISEEEFGKLNPNKFGRLDPQKKEIGIRVDKAEKPLFLQGIKWFENATSLKVIRFNETEIRNNRRFNNNGTTAHVYDQYVLILYKGLLGSALGSVFTPVTHPDIPANTFSVVIDIDAINNEYNSFVAKEKPTALPFTQAEFTANVVAHELGHGVSAWHHGQEPDLLSPINANSGPPLSIKAYDGKNWKSFNPPFIRIFNRNGVQLSLPYTLKGTIGQKGNTESGDLSCIMAYVPYCSWSFMVGADGAWIYNEVPFLNVGKKMCTSPKGTSINAGIIYFGDAVKGNCLSQIKLK